MNDLRQLPDRLWLNNSEVGRRSRNLTTGKSLIITRRRQALHLSISQDLIGHRIQQIPFFGQQVPGDGKYIIIPGLTNIIGMVGGRRILPDKGRRIVDQIPLADDTGGRHLGRFLTGKYPGQDPGDQRKKDKSFHLTAFRG
jgi:hypothetical protein